MHNACPRSWCNKQSRTNQLGLRLQRLITYYATLNSIEKDNNGKPNRNRNRNRKQNKDKQGKGRGKGDAICPIYGNHTISK